MANKKKKKTKSAFEVLDQRRNEQIAQMSKGSTSTYKKLNKMLAPSSKEQISTGSIKTNNQTSIDYASNNTRDVSRQIIAPTASTLTSNMSNPLELLQEQRENQTEENQQNEKLKMPSELLQEQQQKQFEEKQQKSKEASEKRVEQKKKDEKDNRTWFKSGAFKDGYDFGDVTKTLVGTGADVYQDATKGIAKIGEALWDTGAYAVGGIAKAVGNDDLSEKMKKFIAKNIVEEHGTSEWATNLSVIGVANNILNGKVKETYNLDNLKESAKNFTEIYNLDEDRKKTTSELQSGKTFEEKSVLGDKSDSLVQSAGQLLGTAGLQAVGVPWWLTTGVSSFGGEVENAFNNNATYGEAGTSGLISAGAEVLTEKISGGIKFGGKALDDGLKRAISQGISNKTLNTLTKLGVDATGEGAEEVLSEVLQSVGQKLTYEDEKTWEELLTSEEAMDRYLESFIGGAVLGGGSSSIRAINSAKTGRDYDTGLTQNEQSVIDNVVSQRTTEIQKQKAVEERINKVIEEQEATRGTLTDEAKQEIKNRVMQEDIDYSTSKLSKKEIAKIEEEVRQDLERGEIDIDTIESTLSSEKTARIKELMEERSKTTNEQERLKIQAEIGKLEEAKNSELIEMLKKDNLLQNSYREANLKNEKFTYEAKDTDSEYKKKLAEDFKKLANNSTRTHETFEMISKIAEDSKTNYSITNNEQLKNLGYDIEGKDVNGLVRVNKDGSQSVLINIDSKKAINRIVGHETTHILEGTKEYDEFKEFAKQYATTKGEYDSRLKSTKELYKGVKDANVENEVTADIVGDYLFTDTDFISNLSTEKPNIFKRVYEEIKHLYKMATAESKEERQLLQLKKSFEKIYQKNEIQTDTKTKYHISKNLNNKIDEVLSDITVRSPVKLRDFTPDILVQNGVKDLPMFENPSHIRKNILTENEAKKLGLSINKNDHYHGLGKELYIDAIDSLDNPRVVFKRNNSNNYLILTTLKDNNGNNIVVPIEIETTTNINRIKIDTNRIKSVYGYKTIDNIDLNDYIKHNIKNSNFTKIYEQKKERGTGFSTAAGSFHKDNIPQSNTNVKSSTSSTKYSIQNNENDTQRTEKSSFSLKQRVSGDALLDAQDFIDEVKSVGAEVDDNGYVTVYHQTSNENADKIKQSGKMFAKEPYVYFSTSKNASQSDGRGSTKLEFKIPAENLILDDIFDDNADVKVKLDSSKELDISDYLVNDENDIGSLKEKQLNIILKNNPVNDDYHTWIRNINDIKTFEETLQDSDYKEYYEAGEDFDETYSANMAKEALETGKITVYSSYPIEQGIFVSPSRMEAESYSGNGKVYSKEVNLTDVAWIDPTQGQYAKINNTDYSLSNGEQTAQSRNDIFGKDIKYQDETKKQVEQAIAPLKEEVKILTKEITDLRENVAPISLEEAEMLRKESFNSITDKDAPIEQETNDYIPENEVTESKDLFEIRDYAEVGKRSINAYQYDNPEVKPYFQDMARGMLQDLKNSTKGERIIDANVLYETNGESGIWGTKRDVPNDIAELLDGVDGKYKLSYKDIEKGLNAIIEDHGAENNVASKRIEFYLDQRLRNGYTDFFYGDVFEPNQDYLNLVSQDNRFNVEEQYNEWLKTLPNELPSDYAPYLEMAKDIVSDSPKTNEISSISNELDRINTIAPINEKAVNNNDLNYIPQNPTKESAYDEPSITNPVDAFLNKELTNRFEKRTKQTVISKQKGKSAFRDTMSYLFVNKNRAIDKFSDEVGNKNIKILADHVNNVFGEISTNISKVQTDNNGKAIGKGITEIFNQARKSKLSEAFDDYLFHKSNIERHKNGKGSIVPANDSARLVLEYDKTYPEFKIWGDEVNNFNKNNLYKQVDAGLITKELADKITSMYDFYVPFFENIERDYVKTDTGEITTRSAVKRAKGGADKNLLGFEKAMMKQTQNTISSIRKNQLYREIIDSTHNKQIGLDLNDGTFADENGYYLTAYEDGSQVSANISKELYDGLNNNLEQLVKDIEQKISLITKPLQSVSNVRRNLLTNWSPTFILTNPIKDLQDATLNSKYLKDWSINYPKALKELFTGKGKHLEQFLNMYGQANLMGDYSIDSGISDITKSVKIKGKSRFGISTLNEMLELAPRYAEYLASIKNGASQMEALYNAREVTTNFGRGGVISKAVNRNGFTFWNASVQGFNKLYRNFSGENGAKGVARGVVGASLKALSLGVAPALYNALMFGLGDDEDEDYKVLPDYIKDNYYLIKTDNGNFIRIPKGRMISVFGSAGRRTLELMQGEKDAFDGYLKNAYSQVGISNPMESNILAPLIQAYGSENGKTWYETDIVPSRLQDVPKDEQYDESIDKLSIWLGEKTGISPYKANYVIDQYTGGIGDMILPTITEEAQSDSDSLLGTAIAPLKDKFTADSTTDNKYVSEFYTKNDELKVKSNSSKATEEDLLVNQYMKSVSSEMGALYSEMREVQANKNLSKSEKYKKAQAIKKQINELAEEGLNGYKNVNKTDNYAEVGGREFYKFVDDETGKTVWAKPKDYELDELNSMGLDIQEKSSYYTTKSKIYDIWDKYGDSDNYESKNKEIGQAIINSGLPDEAKYSLYDFSKGKYADTETTQALKLLDLDADTFISYASQTFKADKDSNGKSISGSKKKKVFDYINSMRNISFEQKAILAKLQYNNYDERNYDIIDYLNNSSMTYEEMEFVLKQMGFKVKSDGTITWD
ncbi:MAG: hypothetical protein MR691_14835 [Clostridium sp.]|nr:hypothetical protein [Clostridium sp.]